MKITVGLDLLKNYQRMPYELHYAIGELIDNSIQAYHDEKKALKKILDKEGKKLEIQIFYDPKEATLKVTDNSTGITKDRLAEAFEIGKKIGRPNEGSALGQFNVGLKSAAIWLCDEWQIKTKRYDEDQELQMVVINKEVFEGNNEILEEYRTVSNVNKHHTILEFNNLRHKFRKPTIEKTKRFLASMYRGFLGKSVDIYWNRIPLEWEGFCLAKDEKGEEIKKAFGPASISPGADEREVRGWIGVLKTDKEGGDEPGIRSGTQNAGISIFRRGRMIEGYPDPWRPKSVFGVGAGSLINQRVVGEIYFNDGKVSYDKSSIPGDDKEILDIYLGDIFNDAGYGLRKAANRKVMDSPPASDPDQDLEDLQNTQEHVEKSNLSEISSQPIAPDIVIQKKIDKTFATAKKENIVKFRIEGYTIEMSPSYENEHDQFLTYQSKKKNQVSAIINMKHPYLANNLVTRTEYYTLIVLMIASRFKIETNQRLTMDDYFEVLDSLMRLEIKRS